MPSSSGRLPRELHPGAWWLWALGLATAASRTTNPLLLGVILAVVAYVVVARRGDSPWSRGLRGYVIAALVVIAIRVVFRMLLDGHDGQHILFRLPEIPLPEQTAGVRLGGPVALEGVLAALYDGMRLATLLLCVGAANVLANAKRLLKSTPSALHELGVAVTIALTVAPQLVESAQRVRRARKLRGGERRGAHVLRQIVIPVMTDALDRSILLAASMDARGHSRVVRATSERAQAVSGALVLTGLGGVCVGTYGLLDAAGPAALRGPALALGLAMAVAGFAIGRQRVGTTRYRPDPWRGPEWLVAGSGIAVAAGMFVVAHVDPGNLDPSLMPLRWPELPVAATLLVLVGALPAWLAPPPKLASIRDPRGSRERPAPALTEVVA